MKGYKEFMYEKLNTYYKFFLNSIRDDIDINPDLDYTILFTLSDSKDNIKFKCRMEAEDRMLLSIDYLDELEVIRNNYKISVLKQDFIDKRNTEWFDQTYHDELIKDGLLEMGYKFAMKLSNDETLKLFVSENFKGLVDLAEDEVGLIDHYKTSSEVYHETKNRLEKKELQERLEAAADRVMEQAAMPEPDLEMEL